MWLNQTHLWLFTCKSQNISSAITCTCQSADCSSRSEGGLTQTLTLALCPHPGSTNPCLNPKPNPWFMSTIQFNPNPSTSSILTLAVVTSHLPPVVCVVSQQAVLPRHQRVDWQVEPLSEPGVVLQLCHTLSTATLAFREVVRLVYGIFEEVQRGISQRETEEESGESYNKG